jgi:hypothetical protein
MTQVANWMRSVTRANAGTVSTGTISANWTQAADWTRSVTRANTASWTVSTGRGRHGEGKYHHQDDDQNKGFFHSMFSFDLFDDIPPAGIRVKTREKGSLQNLHNDRIDSWNMDVIIAGFTICSNSNHRPYLALIPCVSSDG